MNILLKNIKIVDPNSGFNGKHTNLGVVNGKITFNTEGVKFSQELDCSGAAVSPGFVDLRSFCGEPGFEHKEDFSSFQNAAKRGGFTEVAVLPNTNPVVDSKDLVQNLINKSKGSVVKIHPIAALSKQAKGEELSEMIDLHSNGAVAFSEGHQPIYHSDLILKGLQYSASLNTTIINISLDYGLSKKGFVNEGVNSTQLGMPGIPSIAEEIAIERDLKLLEYAKVGHLHFSLVTTKKGIDLIKKAKKQGLNVTCDTAAHYLMFDDEVLNTFDSNYKVFPPFRIKEDVKALKRALKDGVIDCIVSDHRPENIENKKLEFDRAEYGISSIETTFLTLVESTDLSDEEIVQFLAIGPRKILNLEVPKIEEGVEANLTLFDLNKQTTINIQSKSKNNSLNNSKLKGKVLGVVNNKSSWFNEV